MTTTAAETVGAATVGAGTTSTCQVVAVRSSTRISYWWAVLPGVNEDDAHCSPNNACAVMGGSATRTGTEGAAATEGAAVPPVEAAATRAATRASVDLSRRRTRDTPEDARCGAPGW